MRARDILIGVVVGLVVGGLPALSAGWRDDPLVVPIEGLPGWEIERASDQQMALLDRLSGMVGLPGHPHRIDRDKAASEISQLQHQYAIEHCNASSGLPESGKNDGE